MRLLSAKTSKCTAKEPALCRYHGAQLPATSAKAVAAELKNVSAELKKAPVDALTYMALKEKEDSLTKKLSFFQDRPGSYNSGSAVLQKERETYISDVVASKFGKDSEVYRAHVAKKELNDYLSSPHLFKAMIGVKTWKISVGTDPGATSASVVTNAAGNRMAAEDYAKKHGYTGVLEYPTGVLERTLIPTKRTFGGLTVDQIQANTTKNSSYRNIVKQAVDIFNGNGKQTKD